MEPRNSKKLRIVHCFRSPIGGIFRHVRDLVQAQTDAGHQVGILCDSLTGGVHEDGLFSEIEPMLELGLRKIPMRRAVTPADIFTLWRCYKQINKMEPDVLHAHGAKGGTYARIIGTLAGLRGKRVARLYCPHGGAMHYDRSTLNGRIYFIVERFLELMTDRLIFVSSYERNAYHEKVGEPRCPQSLIYNGLRENEFTPVNLVPSATEFLYIGMMRDLKGPDIFLHALGQARKMTGRDLKAHFIGDGPDKQKYLRLIQELELQSCVTVHDAMPARKAFALGKIIVVPSRAESMPYLVLEATAASKPIVATRVGGIPEIFENEPEILVPPDNVGLLAQRMCAVLEETGSAVEKRAENLRGRFSLTTMSSGIEEAYLASL